MKSSYSNKIAKSRTESQRIVSKLDENAVSYIREHQGIISQTEMANQFGVSRTLIADIINYRVWNEHQLVSEDIIPSQFKHVDLEFTEDSGIGTYIDDLKEDTLFKYGEFFSY